MIMFLKVHEDINIVSRVLNYWLDKIGLRYDRTKLMFWELEIKYIMTSVFKTITKHSINPLGKICMHR